MRRLLQKCALRLVILGAALGLAAGSAYGQQVPTATQGDGQQTPASAQPPANPQPPCCPPPSSINCWPTPSPFSPDSLAPSTPGSTPGTTGMGDTAAPSFATPSFGAGVGSTTAMVGDSLNPPILKAVTVQATQTQTVTTYQTVKIPIHVSTGGMNTGGTNMLGQTDPIVFKTITVPVTVQESRPVNVTTFQRVANTGIGALNIADDQSPIPQDRAFVVYNSFSDVTGPAAAFFASQHTITQGNSTITIPGVAAPQLQVQREEFGFEKTFLDGNASIGVRIPVFEAGGAPGFNTDELGDISVSFTYAFFQDQAGDAFTGGLVVTVPSAPAVNTIGGDLNPTFLQPFLGYRWAQNDWYVHGFSSVSCSTDEREATSLFNDIGVGYWLYRGTSNEGLNAIIPTLEAHVFTPLSHRAESDLFYTPDFVAVTAGVHIGWGNALLTVGVVAPVVGPSQFPIEAVVELQLRF
jgi:hypothetical protein